MFLYGVVLHISCTSGYFDDDSELYLDTSSYTGTAHKYRSAKDTFLKQAKGGDSSVSNFRNELCCFVPKEEW